MARTVEQALAYNKDSHEIIWKQLTGTKFAVSQRMGLVMAYVSVSLTHHDSIAKLVVAHNKASAFALLRSQIEAAFRGLWVNLIATDVQVAAIGQKGAEPFPKFKAMAAELDEKYGADGWLKSFEDQWATLNGYTHTGLEQLGHQFLADGNLAPNYPDENVSSVLVLSGTVSIGLLVPLFRSFSLPEKAETLEKWLAERSQKDGVVWPSQP